ncbi:MAG: zf-HC2 domain-containing protein [Pseudohongiellaceae bacterium]
MLNCRDIAHTASDYLDQNLSWRERLAVRLHLLMCANCKRFVSHMALTVAYMRIRPSAILSYVEAEVIELQIRIHAAEQEQQG